MGMFWKALGTLTSNLEKIKKKSKILLNKNWKKYSNSQQRPRKMILYFTEMAWGDGEKMLAKNFYCTTPSFPNWGSKIFFQKFENLISGLYSHAHEWFFKKNKKKYFFKKLNAGNAFPKPVGPPKQPQSNFLALKWSHEFIFAKNSKNVQIKNTFFQNFQKVEILDFGSFHDFWQK